MKTILAVVLMGIGSWVNAQLSLPRVFADHMVIQRNQPTKIWGWAAPGDNVQISFGTEKLKAKTDNQGYFEAYLSAKPAGGPYVLTIAADTTYKFEDVVIGDVWIAGGQSNMEWQLQWQVDNWEAEVQDSEYPDIRFFKVPNQYAPTPQRDITGGEWLSAGAENTPAFSAVAWFFAKQNHLEKGVPVGIIESNWGGTPAEAWTSIETLSNTPGYEQIADTILAPTVPWAVFTKENDAKEARKWELMRDEAGAVASGAQQIAYDDSEWIKYDLPCNCKMTDLTWLRKELTLNPDTIEELSIYISNVVQEAFVFFNGKLIWTKTWSDDIKELVIPQSEIRSGKNVLAYRVANSWDNNVYFGRPDEMWMKVNGKKSSLEGDWRYSNDVESKIPQPVKMFQMPSFLYNAMIVPVGGYTARGVIWYQGESNTGQPQYYHQLFTNMISDWRQLWGPDLSFLYVQLANFMERKAQPEESQWAELRAAQTETLALPNTGMAVAIDIGEAQDIHPRNKLDVGKRLWLAAKKVSYGDDAVYSGPQYAQHTIEGARVSIHFDHVQNGFKPVEVLKGFSIAGANGEYVWAEAKIEDNKVVVWSPQVANPTQVRYAWADNPACNLYNQEGLPAVPFQTSGNRLKQ